MERKTTPCYLMHNAAAGEGKCATIDVQVARAPRIAEVGRAAYSGPSKLAPAAERVSNEPVGPAACPAPRLYYTLIPILCAASDERNRVDPSTIDGRDRGAPRQP